LLIDGEPQAAFDFEIQRGFSRTRVATPIRKSRGSWPASDHDWSDAAIAWLDLRRTA
jgi:hypothetical protein